MFCYTWRAREKHNNKFPVMYEMNGCILPSSRQQHTIRDELWRYCNWTTIAYDDDATREAREEDGEKEWILWLVVGSALFLPPTTTRKVDDSNLVLQPNRSNSTTRLPETARVFSNYHAIYGRMNRRPIHTEWRQEGDNFETSTHCLPIALPRRDNMQLM